jgi:hypothetical protein
MANLYFLMLFSAEFVPKLSGKPWFTFPDEGPSLFLVISISMIKDVYEDFFVRRKSDNDENNRIAKVSK